MVWLKAPALRAARSFQAKLINTAYGKETIALCTALMTMLVLLKSSRSDIDEKSIDRRTELVLPLSLDPPALAVWIIRRVGSESGSPPRTDY